MEPFYVIFQFDSLFQLLSGITLAFLIISLFSYLRLNKIQREKILKMDKIIKELENYKN